MENKNGLLLVSPTLVVKNFNGIKIVHANKIFKTYLFLKIKKKTSDYAINKRRKNINQGKSFSFFQTFPIKEKPPFGIFWNQNFLPSSWSLKDRWDWLDKKKRFDWGDIEISSCDLKVTYRGLGRSDEDAASIRSNKPIPEHLPIFYYEIKILNIGEFGYIGIGLCSPHVDLDRLPGWERDSLGYHGDDGHAFRDSGTGIPYGPSFITGDIIGVCLSQIQKKIFFTKNGNPLPPIFGDIFDFEIIPSYPMVGLRTPGETVEINFGRKPFEFDLNWYIQKLFYIFIERIFFLEKFLPLHNSKENTCKKGSNFGQIVIFDSLKEKNWIFKKLIRKSFFFTQKKLFNFFCYEENLLYSTNSLKYDTFCFWFLEKLGQFFLFFFVFEKNFKKIFFSQRNIKTFFEIFFTFSFKKILLWILKIKGIKEKTNLQIYQKNSHSKYFKKRKRSAFSHNKFFLLTQKILHKKTTEFFFFLKPMKIPFYLESLLSFLKVGICNLKNKGARNFSILFIESVFFYINLSPIIFYI